MVVTTNFHCFTEAQSSHVTLVSFRSTSISNVISRMLGITSNRELRHRELKESIIATWSCESHF